MWRRAVPGRHRPALPPPLLRQSIWTVSGSTITMAAAMANWLTMLTTDLVATADSEDRLGGAHIYFDHDLDCCRRTVYETATVVYI